jgi:hypothetical protein
MAEANDGQDPARASGDSQGVGREALGSSRSIPREENTLQPEQTVSEMANEVLARQAQARVDRDGEPIEEAMETVLKTEAGQQLRELRDGPHGEEGVQEAQVEAARDRARERAGDLGERLGKVPGSPTHG